MNKATLSAIKGMLCSELEDIVKKGNFSAGDLDAVHKMTDTIKNVYKIEMMDDGEYSTSNNDMNTLRMALDILRR